MATYGDSGRPNYSENFTPTTQNLKYEWRIKNAKDRSEAWQIKQLKTYRAGIEELEQGQIGKFEALKHTYTKQTRLQKPRKRVRN